MGFLFTPLPLWVAIGAWVVTVGLLALALWKNPFKRLQDATLQHVWLAIAVAISVLWASNAWLEDGTVLHLLGATLVVTLFDWGLALVAMGIVVGLAALVFDAPWEGVALTFLIFGAFPVAISALLQRACTAWLPRNLFMFIVGQGFVSPAIAVSAAAYLALGTHVTLNGGSAITVPAGYAFSVFLLASGEAWFTGMATALIAVYRPAWVTTYDVRRYRLGGPRT
ncbi:energy-coupling factor ABC transporter permease [Paraburkholderia sp. CNPSo 3274]|uniref:energy-coupling factor ABC transporter permease n=1 Tax=Paraburkholderia sp. CNPSo 3274 TaxID=2940932 RepID=UPI0020B8B1C6|nr:energy-coupling factor ABC transporter permease [Paraburkholderia sp. CNPSo 3274]MCP3711638.1 energy-coupling factor ABC transporter permease [Paraburkholderia sp. CNPSo 3274]